MNPWDVYFSCYATYLYSRLYMNWVFPLAPKVSTSFYSFCLNVCFTHKALILVSVFSSSKMTQQQCRSHILKRKKKFLLGICRNAVYEIHRLEKRQTDLYTQKIQITFRLTYGGMVRKWIYQDQWKIVLLWYLEIDLFCTKSFHVRKKPDSHILFPLCLPRSEGRMSLTGNLEMRSEILHGNAFWWK